MIFVFGSNLAGRHGKGAALCALKDYGAIYGCGLGPQGNSYAIPTKDTQLSPLPLDVIRGYVLMFIGYALCFPERRFNVTAIGCGLAGYTPEQIAPMFQSAPDNCILPEEFISVLRKNGPPPEKEIDAKQRSREEKENQRSLEAKKQR